MQASLADENVTCWVLSDGKAGDEVQCLGVAETLGLAPQIRHVAPRAPWTWLMPWGPIDPREAPKKPGSPLSGPFPDLAIASGRRAVAYLRKIKRASHGRTFTVFLKDPRTGTGAADFIWVPEHDRLRGANVLTTLTSPHRVSAERLAAARRSPLPALAALPAPRICVLVGGASDAYRFESNTVQRFCTLLRQAADQGTLMGTFSRRSALAHPDLVPSVTRIFQETGGYLWNGEGENPYIQLLANANAIVVTADSVNMVGEAAATGHAVHVFHPLRKGNTHKFDAFLQGLDAAGAVRPFTGRMEYPTYEAIDSTPAIAAEIAVRFRAHRTAL